MLEQFEQIGKDALSKLKEVTDSEQLEQFRVEYLGRKGRVTQMLSQIGEFSKEQRAAAGQLANKIKKDVTGTFEELKQKLTEAQKAQSKELIDMGCNPMTN